jgi:hypothetical protein
MRGTLGLGLLVFGCFSAIGVFSLFAKGETSTQHVLVVISLIGVAGLFGLGISRVMAADRRLRQEMLSAGGVSPNSRLSFFNDDDGIAINLEAQTFTLMQGGLYKTYPFSAFRAYRTYFQPNGNSRVGVASVSGLFVTVHCDRRPEWHIKMLLQADQARWAQILDIDLIAVAEAA